VLPEFLAFINQRTSIRPGQRLLLAVSGGIDSVVLTELIRQSGFPFGLAHVNFSLRGAESDRDAAFVRALAGKLGVSFHYTQVDTHSVAAENGWSTQLAARNLRYDWFAEIREQKGYDWIVTAHHLTDSLETVLLNLVRGTGLAGLHGIPVQNGRVCRPLLCFSREELFDFARNNQLEWVEDSSNATTDYSRNRIRHDVLPVLRELNPGLEKTFRNSLDRLSAADRWFQALLLPLHRQVAENGRIDAAWLAAQPEPLLLFSELLRPYGFSYRQAVNIYENPAQQTGRYYFSGTHRLLWDRGVWMLDKADNVYPSFHIEENMPLVSAPGFTLTFEKLSRTSFLPGNDPSVAWLDAERIPFPLVLRPWQAGDRFCPLGLGGKAQKVSDYLVDQKIPRNEKNGVYVLESNHEIAWIVGRRADERFKITENTKGIIRVACQKESSLS
jgi:tRNA(Ile)-lysidine synthase